MLVVHLMKTDQATSFCITLQQNCNSHEDASAGVVGYRREVLLGASEWDVRGALHLGKTVF